MNHIQRMIQDLCPEGVEYRTLGEVGTFIRGNGLQKKDFTSEGVGCIHYGQIYTHYGLSATKTKSYVSKELATKLKTVQTGDVIFAVTSENMDDVCKCVAWLGQDDIVTGGHSVIFKHKQNPKYLAYFFNTEAFAAQKRKYARGVKVIDIKAEDLAKIVIPTPPLAIQEEIVRILDTFTQLDATLEEELRCRKLQYQYYRDRLLTFDNTVPRVRMEEVFEFRNGYTPSKAKEEYWTNGTVPWFRMEDIRKSGRILSDAIQHITPEAVKGGRLFKAGSFILATTATIGEHALLIADSLANQQFTNLRIRESLLDTIDTKFLYHYFYIIDEWCKRNVNISGFASVDMAGLKNLPIPLPPLSEQKRIAGILDKFEAITTDLQSGLPAEIQARRKQYEYYRDLLLTFPQKQ